MLNPIICLFKISKGSGKVKSFWFIDLQDRITDLQAQTQHFAEVGHFDADSLQDKSRGIAERYDK